MFLPNQTELLFSISVINDNVTEDLEQFEVLLTASAGVFIASPARAVVSIFNDDVPGILNLLLWPLCFASYNVNDPIN